MFILLNIAHYTEVLKIMCARVFYCLWHALIYMSKYIYIWVKKSYNFYDKIGMMVLINLQTTAVYYWASVFSPWLILFSKIIEEFLHVWSCFCRSYFRLVHLLSWMQSILISLSLPNSQSVYLAWTHFSFIIQHKSHFLVYSLTTTEKLI